MRPSAVFIKILAFSLLFVFTMPTRAADCLLQEALKNSKLNSNPQFWEELNQLSANGQPSNHSLNSLIEKYSGKGTELKNNSSSLEVVEKIKNSPLRYSLEKKAEKEIRALPPNLRIKADEFLEVALRPGGLQELGNNPGRWNFEKLIQHGKNAYTVRLNGGYRILFDIEDKELKIRRVNKGQIHEN